MYEEFRYEIEHVFHVDLGRVWSWTLYNVEMQPIECSKFFTNREEAVADVQDAYPGLKELGE